MGYAASGRTKTSCIDGTWTVNPDSMTCELTAILIVKDYGYAEIIGNGVNIELPRASSDDPSVDFDRYALGLVYADSKVIMCGGGSNPNTQRTCLELTSFEDNKWAAHSNMTTDREGHGLTSLLSTLVALGGDYEKTMEFGDPRGTDWVLNEEPLPENFENGCALKISPEELIYTGGLNNYVYNIAVRFNLISNSFISLPDMIYERVFHSCALVHSNNSTGVLVAGGMLGPYSDDESLSSTEFFDFETNEWIEV